MTRRHPGVTNMDVWQLTWSGPTAVTCHAWYQMTGDGDGGDYLQQPRRVAVTQRTNQACGAAHLSRSVHGDGQTDGQRAPSRLCRRTDFHRCYRRPLQFNTRFDWSTDSLSDARLSVQRPLVGRTSGHSTYCHVRGQKSHVDRTLTDCIPGSIASLTSLSRRAAGWRRGVTSKSKGPSKEGRKGVVVASRSETNSEDHHSYHSFIHSFIDKRFGS